MNRPKALVCHADGRTWLETSVAALADGGCSPIAVVLGAAADQARGILPDSADLTVLENKGWREGVGSSLRSALQWCMQLETQVSAALVMLVDTPGINSSVVRYMLAHASSDEILARATYGDEGVPHHPVLLGRAHWEAICASSKGDAGANDYLSRHPTRVVDCSAYGHGDDVDERPNRADRHA